MRLSLIAAIGQNHQLGLDNKMLWKLKNDFKRFKELTSGHHIVMGRKTYESIGRPLPNRTTIVVTRNPRFTVEGHFTVGSLEAAIELAKSRGEAECFICGGEQIYRQTIDRSDRLYISHVDFNGTADTFFPDIPEGFQTVGPTEVFQANEFDEYAWKFTTYEKQ